MPPTAVSHSESDRVALLHATKLLNATHAPAFDALTRLAASITGQPQAAINLVDTHVVWSLSGVGLNQTQNTRDRSLCHLAIAHDGPLLVSDSSSDGRLASMPSDGFEAMPRAYAGFPLVVEGLAVGALCVFGPETHTWQDREIANLTDLAISATALIEAQLKAQRARVMQARVKTASLSGSDLLWETDKDGMLRWVSARLTQHTGLDPANVIGERAVGLLRPRGDETQPQWEAFLQARQRREPFRNVIADRVTPMGVITVSVSGTPVFNSRGEFMGYRGASRNVTHQIVIEREARRADHLLRQAIESFQISVMITDVNGQVLLANQHWRDHVGNLFDEHGQHWPSILRALIKRGDYPDAKNQEEAYYEWRLNLREQATPQETRFADRWLLIKDHDLPDHCVVHFAMDITQSKRDAALLTEQQNVLFEARARLSAVLSALPDLWFVIDANDCVVDAHEGHPMLIRPLEQLRGQPLGSGLPDEQARAQREAVRQVRSSRQAQWLEYKLRSPEGKLRHFEARMTPMPDKQILFLTRDITERERAAEELRVSEELYRSVAATISDGLVIVELSGRVVALNPAASRILGVPQDVLVNLTSPSLLGIEFLQDDLQQPLPVPEWPIAATLAKGERIVDRVHPLRRPDGQIVWVQVSSHLLRVDPNAEPFAAMATLRDITLERQAQQALQLSEERWGFALEGAGDGVWDWDLARGHVFYSHRWKGMLGYDDHEVQHNLDELFRLVHPDDREALAKTLTHCRKLGDEILQTEFRMQHRDGRYLCILSRGKVVSRGADAQPQRIVGTHSDITPIKQAELALREKQTAEAANAAKTEFLSRMSHEIRTPLNAVNGFAQLLKLQLGQSDACPTQASYVNQILHASQHLMGLVNDVLDLQQVEAGILSIKPEALSLDAEVAQCLSMLSPMAAQRSITLSNRVDGPWHVVADRQRLRQIIMNIGSNAIKYNQAGGMVRLSVDSAMPQGLSLIIEDTGAGLSAQQLSLLYQPFERLGRETSAIEGTGLGLIITRSLIHAMGGHMNIRSQPGAGTRVQITLPRVGEAPHAEPELTLFSTIDILDTTPMPPQSDSANAPMRVLYVEDNRINAMLFEEALRPYPQLELSIAEDGQMALSMALETQPEVLVLDAHLPGMSGFQVLEALRMLPALANVPAYMCSADAMPEDLVKAEKAGFVGYWTKPIDITAVTTELCRLADSRDNTAP